MKRFLRRALAGAALTLFFATLAAPAARATEVGTSRRFGLGFALGSYNSIIGKYFLNSQNALDFGIGFWPYHYGCGHNNNCDNGYRSGPVSLHGDYLWQENLVRDTVKLDWHIGVGARVGLNDDYYNHGSALAARMPVGLDSTFTRPRFLEAFFEFAPAVYLLPPLDLGLEAFLGVRFYF